MVMDDRWKNSQKTSKNSSLGKLSSQIIWKWCAKFTKIRCETAGELLTY